MGIDHDQLSALAAAAFADEDTNSLRQTHALVVMAHGDVVFERYGYGFDENSTFLSWSMAKSITSALCGVLVGEGLLDLDAPAPVAAWHETTDDPRAEITLRHLLQMRSGLRWNEDYVDNEGSDVIEMLFGGGKADTAGFAIDCALATVPGSEFEYSSGTTNIIARIMGDCLGSQAAFEEALVDGLLRPAGMQHMTVKFDEAGTFIGSSFAYATARDYLAFGELYRNDGVVKGTRLLPPGWVAASIEDHATCPDSGQGYGLQWWLARDEHESFAANGYDGQRLQVSQSLGTTFVRLGKTSDDYSPDLRAFYADVTSCLAS